MGAYMDIGSGVLVYQQYGTCCSCRARLAFPSLYIYPCCSHCLGSLSPVSASLPSQNWGNILLWQVIMSVIPLRFENAIQTGS